MARSIVLFILFIVAGFSARSQKCGSYISPRKYHSRWGNQFTLSDTSQLRTTGVYLYTYVNKTDTSKTISSYYHFYPDGQVFVSGNYCSRPALSVLTDTSYGGLYRYRIKKGKLEVEVYGGPGYFVEKGSLSEGEKIVFDSYKSRGISTSVQKYPKPRSAVFIPFIK